MPGLFLCSNSEISISLHSCFNEVYEIYTD